MTQFRLSPFYAHVGFAQVLPQQAQIRLSIFIERKGCLPVYSALGDVIRNSRKNTARSSRHRRALYMEAENRADQAVPDLSPFSSVWSHAPGAGATLLVCFCLPAPSVNRQKRMTNMRCGNVMQETALNY